jgi:predicted protein tyrosine phosphatase
MNKIPPITVCSRSIAKEFKWSKPWAIISISEDPTQFPVLLEENRSALLQVEFADLEFNSGTSNFKLFDEADAENILSFVESLPNDVEVLIIHCGAGISRSAAVAAALSKMTNGSDGGFFDSPYSPNSKVYHTMLKVAENTGRYNHV